MSNKICPLMSRYDSENAVPNWVSCAEENCALWTDKNRAYFGCGLIKE